MKLVRGDAGAGRPALGAMAGAVLLTAGLLVSAWLRLGMPRPVCALKRWTGLPCPTCGSTRLGEALLRGDILEAVSWNPLVFAFLAVAALWAGASTTRVVLGLRPWHVALAVKERRILAVAAALAVVATWIYLIERGV